MQRNLSVLLFALLSVLFLPVSSSIAENSIVERARQMIADSNQMTGVTIIGLQYIGCDPENQNVRMFAIEFDRPTPKAVGLWSILIPTGIGFNSFKMDRLGYIHLVTFDTRVIPKNDGVPIPVNLRIGATDPLTHKLVTLNLMLSGNEVAVQEEDESTDESSIEKPSNDDSTAIVDAFGECVAQLKQRLDDQ